MSDAGSRELQRQACLRAMGLVPWVARRPLPGAAASAELEWPEPVRAPEQDAAAELRDRLGPPVGGVPSTTVEAIPTDDSGPGEPATAGPRFGLHAYQAGDLRLVFQLAGPDAPGPDRREARLLAALLRIWHASPGKPRRLVCPPNPSGILSPDQAGEILTSFLQALAGSRVLLCMDESVLRLVTGTDRYEPWRQGEQDLLGISSPREMLADPSEHKPRSWRAMVRAGFHE